MRKIIRYWNQNRKQIIIVIAIIAFIIIMLQVVNELLKPTKESNQNNNNYELNNFESLQINLASTEKILEWSHGEVTKPEPLTIGL